MDIERADSLADKDPSREMLSVKSLRSVPVAGLGGFCPYLNDSCEPAGGGGWVGPPPIALSLPFTLSLLPELTSSILTFTAFLP